LSTSFFKRRKNKRFSYTPRFSKENGSEEKLRDSSSTENFMSNWQEERNADRHRRNRRISLRLLFFILVLVLIMYVYFRL